MRFSYRRSEIGYTRIQIALACSALGADSRIGDDAEAMFDSFHLKGDIKHFVAGDAGGPITIYRSR
jgi:hypothetical protein